MTLKEARTLADRVAKGAMLYVPLGFVFTAVAILCVAAKPSFIAPGLLGALLGSFLILVLCLIPSWFLERLDNFLENNA